jgi:hypothetical protein
MLDDNALWVKLHTVTTSRSTMHKERPGRTQLEHTNSYFHLSSHTKHISCTSQTRFKFRVRLLSIVMWSQRFASNTDTRHGCRLILSSHIRLRFLVLCFVLWVVEVKTATLACPVHDFQHRIKYP